MQVDVPAKETETFTYVILCPAWDEDYGLTCDLVIGHAGAHQASVRWGDEDDE